MVADSLAELARQARHDLTLSIAHECTDNETFAHAEIFAGIAREVVSAVFRQVLVHSAERDEVIHLDGWSHYYPYCCMHLEELSQLCGHGTAKIFNTQQQYVTSPHGTAFCAQPGDWIWSACNASNFARRTSCFQCGSWGRVRTR